MDLSSHRGTGGASPKAAHVRPDHIGLWILSEVGGNIGVYEPTLINRLNPKIFFAEIFRDQKPVSKVATAQQEETP